MKNTSPPPVWKKLLGVSLVLLSSSLMACSSGAKSFGGDLSGEGLRGAPGNSGLVEGETVESVVESIPCSRETVVDAVGAVLDNTEYTISKEPYIAAGLESEFTSSYQLTAEAQELKALQDNPDISVLFSNEGEEIVTHISAACGPTR